VIGPETPLDPQSRNDSCPNLEPTEDQKLDRAEFVSIRGRPLRRSGQWCVRLRTRADGSELQLELQLEVIHYVPRRCSAPSMRTRGGRVAKGLCALGGDGRGWIRPDRCSPVAALRCCTRRSTRLPSSGEPDPGGRLYIPLKGWASGRVRAVRIALPAAGGPITLTHTAASPELASGHGEQAHHQGTLAG
jgi:hypothetical protein